MFEFDSGSSGSSGPFISWHANGRKDGEADAKTFSMKDGDKREDITEKFQKGVVFDIDNMKTGWSLFGMNGSEWQWNQSVARFAPKPGDDWKKGVSIPIALGKDQSGVWQQAGSGTFLSISDLAASLKDRESGKLPMVKMTGTFDVNFNGGGSTVCAKLEVAKWVDRPDCLNGSDDGIGGLADEAGDDDEF